jgi:hypothetical protein
MFVQVNLSMIVACFCVLMCLKILHKYNEAHGNLYVKNTAWKAALYKIYKHEPQFQSSQNKCLALLSSCFLELQTVITIKVGFNYTLWQDDMYFA